MQFLIWGFEKVRTAPSLRKAFERYKLFANGINM